MVLGKSYALKKVPPRTPPLTMGVFLRKVFLQESRIMTHWNKVLLVRTDRLGDVILSLPLAEAVKMRFPNSYVGFLCQKYTQPVVEMSDYVDDVITVDCDNLLQRISEFDVAVLIHPTPRDAILLWRAGIEIRIGTSYRLYSFLLTHRVAEHRKDCRYHELTYNLHLLRPLGIDVEWLPPKLRVPDDAKGNAQKLIRSLGLDGEKFLAIHPGSSGSSLAWSRDRFEKFARLLEVKNIPFIVTAGPGELDLARSVAGGGAVVSDVDLKTLAGIYSFSSAVIAPNTGTLHLADAVGTKAFSSFPMLRTMSPRRWAPANFRKGAITPENRICKKCSRKCHLFPCPDLITPELMLERILENTELSPQKPQQ